jgi:hypothetical protein
MVDEVPKNLNSQEQEQIHGEHYSKHGTKRKQHCSVFFHLEAKLTNETSSHSRFFKIHLFVKEASMGLHNDMNVEHTHLNCLLQKPPLIERSHQ